MPDVVRIGLIYAARIGLGLAVLDLLLISSLYARQTPQSLAEIQFSFAPLVAKSSPSVVNIYAQRRTKNRPAFRSDFFERFFGEFGFPREHIENSLGSGVIIDPEGLVVTNLHVFRGARDIRVITHDRREYHAKLVLSDPKTDLAIIRLMEVKHPLDALAFADAYDAKVGDLAIAIGNPFGVSQTVTLGIISGLSRNEVSKDRFQSFIQTDAAINPGNSGGALIDTQGKLLGINSAIISPSGGSSGLGFAIPANMINPLLYAAKKNIPLNRVWLGFTPQEVDNAIAEAMGMEFPQGVLVNQPHPDSPADQAGLTKGDLIIAVDDIVIESPSALQFYMATLIPEKTPSVTLRMGDAREVVMPVAFPPAIPNPDPHQFNDNNFLSGANVVNLSPFIAEHLAVPISLEGVVINRVKRRSIADRLGFKHRDIIQEINGIAITDTQQLQRIVRDIRGGEPTSVQISRAGKTLQRKFN